MNLQLGLGIVGNHTPQSTRESISSPIGIAGIVKSGGPPPNATQNEMKIWDHTHKAFLNDEVFRLLYNSSSSSRSMLLIIIEWYIIYS